ncbi:outer membrane protein assembly factor BamB family protein [Candidatus Uabimicrobium amorphum]|uniref:Pyrrolo-quinoline quinone repeat domain-containing protein n=1 Tax=Uabimicrobium amorphum TaxID=2596890 RepID=A0A5S9IJC9_UABAM|nr:PQQ-like beta-propeller repeat protein [Candidatus Uabimicrobium amorphum]BBM82130.1 hypothetical protein UABAM_00473 [Candidatus Uabimicrobium amorphum]
MKMFIICSMLLSISLYADNWPNWRGVENNGISSEKEFPAKWDKDNIHWRLPLPGEGMATPVVWQNKIFVTSAKGNDLVLLCINTNGKVLWERKLGTGNRSVFSGEGNFASPSPSTDGKYVWTFISSGDLACYDFDGKKIWHVNIAKRYENFKMYFVMSSTPLLDGDRLYLQLIHANAQRVLALDKNTGNEIWKHKRQSDARAECLHSYASPVIYRDENTELLLVHGSDYITAHSLKDGKEIWRHGELHNKNRYNPSLRLVASPVVTKGLIVVPSAKNGPVLGLTPNGKKLWLRKRGTPDVPSPLIYDNLLYLCRENGDLICMDAITGKEFYKHKTDRSRHRTSPVYIDGKIYVISRSGVVTVVKAGKEFSVLATNTLNETIAASPAIANGVIYLRSYKALYAIGKK